MLEFRPFPSKAVGQEMLPDEEGRPAGTITIKRAVAQVDVDLGLAPELALAGIECHPDVIGPTENSSINPLISADFARLQLLETTTARVIFTILFVSLIGSLRMRPQRSLIIRLLTNLGGVTRDDHGIGSSLASPAATVGRMEKIP